MKSFTITENDSGQRVDRFILKMFPQLPKSLMYKEIRKKNIKINKKRTAPDALLNAGDVIELYLNDDVLKEKTKHYDFMGASKNLNIIYEDENILIADKPPGLLCHPDGREYIDTLTARIKRYLYEKKEWNPDESGVFSPSLANRIDRNTGGIVVAAKNAAALRVLNDKIKRREIEKYYLAVVHGKMEKTSDTLCAFLSKDEASNKVSVSDKETPDSKRIITKYTVLDCKSGKSLLEIDLKTGRTHQIRAHLASIGHPLVHDGKYGHEQGRYRQALYSYKIIFNFKSAAAPLDYLRGREFTAENCELIRNFLEGKYE